MSRSNLRRKVGMWSIRIFGFPFRLLSKLRGSWKTTVGKAFHKFWTFSEPQWSQAGRKLVVPARDLRRIDYFNPFYWIVWASKFIFSWLISRPYLNLGPALLSILVIGAIAATYLWDQSSGQISKVSQYKETLSKASLAGNQKLAILANRRLLEETPDNVDLLFQRALLTSGESVGDATKAQLWRLATEKKHGSSAYWLIANCYPMDGVKEWDSSRHAEFRKLIDVCFDEVKGRQLDDIKLILASYLAQFGARGDAMKLLREIAVRNPDVAFVGLGLAYQERNDKLSKEFAELASNYFANKLKQEPGSVDLRLNLAKSLVILDREQEAAQLLQEGLKLSATSMDDTDKIKFAIGEVLVYFVNRIGKEKSPSETLLQRLTIVTNALRFAPNHPNVINAIVDIVFECQKNQDQQVVALRKALLDGASPEAVHFIKGTLDLLSGNTASAKDHLEIARSTGLNMPGILNNLAMAMIDTESTETLEKALELSTEAVREMPDHPYLRDTRGRVLVKLKRLPEAIPELEFALRSPELAAEIHKLLSQVYQDLGQADLAAGHKQRYDSLVKKNTKE